MTREHPDALAYRRTADAFRSGDLDLVGTLIAPEVVWHVPGGHHMAGRIDGLDAVLPWLAQLRRISPWLVEHDVFASDDHVCAISTIGVRRDGVDLQTRFISIFRYRDGRMVDSQTTEHLRRQEVLGPGQRWRAWRFGNGEKVAVVRARRPMLRMTDITWSDGGRRALEVSTQCVMPFTRGCPIGPQRFWARSGEV